jgi:hypothetical protein
MTQQIDRMKSEHQARIESIQSEMVQRATVRSYVLTDHLPCPQAQQVEELQRKLTESEEKCKRLELENVSFSRLCSSHFLQNSTNQKLVALEEQNRSLSQQFLENERLLTQLASLSLTQELNVFAPQQTTANLPRFQISRDRPIFEVSHCRLVKGLFLASSSKRVSAVSCVFLLTRLTPLLSLLDIC